MSGSAANLRMVSTEPSTASGGTTAFTRLPSGRRASTIGLDSSTRRPIRDTILSIVRRRWASSVKCASAGDQLARLLQPDAVVAVDHDLGDVRVAQVRLDRPVPQDVVADLLGDAGPVAAAQRPVLRAQHVGEDLADLGVELVLVHVGVVEMRTHLLQQLDVDAALELLDPVRLRGAGRSPAASPAPEQPSSTAGRSRAGSSRRCSAPTAAGRSARRLPPLGRRRRPRLRRATGVGLRPRRRPGGRPAPGRSSPRDSRAAARRSARFMATYASSSGGSSPPPRSAGCWIRERPRGRRTRRPGLLPADGWTR